MLRRYMDNVIERVQAEYDPVDVMPWSYISELDAFTIYHKVQEKQKSTTDFSLLDALGHAVAGAAGTAVSNVLVYPLDLVVTRLQVQQKKSRKTTALRDDTQYNSLQDAILKIYQNEGGLPGFYAGCAQDTCKSVTDSFLFFLFYNSPWRAWKTRHSKGKHGVFQRILGDVGIGMIAGAATRGITAPIQQVITRKQTMAMASASQAADEKPHKLGREQSVADILREIYRTKGLQGFWSGYSATIILTLNPSFTMSVDSTLRRLVSGSRTPGATVTFLVAAISKAIASSVMYPVALAKTRAQAAAVTPSQDDTQRSGTGGVLMMIPQTARADGLKALYAGLSGEVVRGFFSHGLTMLVKQRIHFFVIQFYFFLMKNLRWAKARKGVESASALSVRSRH